ncbi:hypothetical protein Taro_045274 [Colocasia esculenta]|uniref:Uncharacterized protein n=1 Tax=Colocasia esculenta TaxID=4460 RepID=A0A843WW75_COLES|nr:hypothetical protein [Colocasia esculenta]
MSLQMSGSITYNGHRLNEFVPQRTEAYVSQQDSHVGELTVRETLEFARQCQGVGFNYELARRENIAGIKPDGDLDLFMKVTMQIYLGICFEPSTTPCGHRCPEWKNVADFLLHLRRISNNIGTSYQQYWFGDCYGPKSFAGLNQGVSSLPLKGWPLTGIDQLRPSLGPQVQKPFLPSQNQFQLLAPQQQHQFLAQAQAQGSIGNTPNSGDMDPRRFRVLPHGSVNGKDGQPAGNNGSIGSPMQSSSPKVRPDQAEYLMMMKMAAQMQQPSPQPSQDQLLQQQQQQLQ